MNKIFLAILLGALVCTAAFSSVESWISIGGELGNYLEFADEEGTKYSSYMMSPGVSINSYEFFNDFDLGLFVHFGILFPIKMTETVNEKETEVDLSGYVILMQFSYLFGPVFRIHLRETLINSKIISVSLL